MKSHFRSNSLLAALLVLLIPGSIGAQVVLTFSPTPVETDVTQIIGSPTLTDTSTPVPVTSVPTSEPIVSPTVTPTESTVSTLLNPSPTPTVETAATTAVSGTPISSSPVTTVPETASLPVPPAASSLPETKKSEVNPNLPKDGAFVLEVGNADWIGSWHQLDSQFGSSANSSALPVGGKVFVGAGCTISQNFQLGAQFQFLAKEAELANVGDESYQFNAYAVGGALKAEVLFPLNDGMNFIGSLEGGYYSLVVSTVKGSGAVEATENMNGSNFGGNLALGLEFQMDSSKSWTLDIGLDYQYLTIQTTTGAPLVSGSSQAFDDTHPVNSTLDFSGIGLFVAIRSF